MVFCYYSSRPCFLGWNSCMMQVVFPWIGSNKGIFFLWASNLHYSSHPLLHMRTFQCWQWVHPLQHPHQILRVTDHGANFIFWNQVFQWVRSTITMCDYCRWFLSGLGLFTRVTRAYGGWEDDKLPGNFISTFNPVVLLSRPSRLSCSFQNGQHDGKVICQPARESVFLCHAEVCSGSAELGCGSAFET